MKDEKTYRLSDEQLLSMVKEGNQMAFNQIYYRYWERLYSKSINILKDKGLAEDVLHEVFMNIWMKRDTIEIKNLRGYLFRAVRNNTLLKIRNEKFFELNKEVISKLTFFPKAEQNLAQRDLKSRISHASKRLPARCRAIFFMSRYDGYTITEIAEHYNISHRTVENQLSIALKHLRGSLKNLYNILLVWCFFN